MKRSLADLETMVQKKICNVCTERTVDGDCGLADPAACALFHLFPQVARAIESVHSKDINDYIEAIRRDVCSLCADRAADGSCQTRQQVRCALDAYLLLVVDAIEEAAGHRFDKRNLGFTAGPGARMRPEVSL